MGYIEDHDYETIIAVCENCGSRCTYNRVNDIGNPGPYGGRDITCLVCQRPFWIYGDVINPPYELYIFGAKDYFRTKRYMLCIANLAQAWEMFFAAFAYSHYLYHPFYTHTIYDRDVEKLERLSSQLDDAIGKFAFAKLRNVLINTILKGVSPKTLRESQRDITRIVAEDFHNTPRKAMVETFPDSKKRTVLEQLLGLQVGELRNKVVHHSAYRPSRAEAEKCSREEIALLYEVRNLLDVRDFDEW